MSDILLTIRLARHEDVLDILRWRNDVHTRRMSRNDSVIEEGEHRRWFDHAVRDPNRLLLLGTDSDKKVGMVRFERSRPEQWEVSIVVAPELRGRKLSFELLGKAVQYFFSLHPEASLLAEIKRYNTASHQLFSSSGFVREPDDCELVRYTFVQKVNK